VQVVNAIIIIIQLSCAHTLQSKCEARKGSVLIIYIFNLSSQKIVTRCFSFQRKLSFELYSQTYFQIIYIGFDFL